MVHGGMGWGGGVLGLYRDEGKENGNYYSSVVGYVKIYLLGNAGASLAGGQRVPVADAATRAGYGRYASIAALGRVD